MATCKQCGDEADEPVAIKIGKKKVRVCEACADLAREQEEVAEQSEAVVQQMMGFKGRR
jgi:ribosome-binding protein aMBF1 (putative translation factor)